MKKIKQAEYEITDYGIEHADYFCGHGSTFTKYRYSALGAGDSYAEALDAAFEQAAAMGFEFDEPEQGNRDKDNRGTEDINCELYYYVGLRW